MSKERVIGQQVIVKLAPIGGVGGYTHNNDNDGKKFMGEVTSFNWENEDELKEHTSLGEDSIGNFTIINKGGSFDISMDKTDSEALLFFIAQQEQHRAMGDSYTKRGKRGATAKFNVMMRTCYVNGFVEEIIFEKTVLRGFGENVGSREDTVTQSIQGRYTRLQLGNATKTNSVGVNNESSVALLDSLASQEGNDEGVAIVYEDAQAIISELNNI